MNIYTKIKQNKVNYVYSHNSNILRSFPEINKPEHINCSDFFRLLAKGRKLAINDNIDFKISQYISNNS